LAGSDRSSSPASRPAPPRPPRDRRAWDILTASTGQSH
jgi:hypothetical protein